jgi:hypothetical protein
MPFRRQFLGQLAALTSSVLLLPRVAVSSTDEEILDETLDNLLEVPLTKPADWDPIAFNRLRGNAGAIPVEYLAEINGPDGNTKHLGKHLPYIPEVDVSLIPLGFVALMWGNAAKGYARHPNAPPNPTNNYQGHWFNWIRIRKATADDAPQMESTYSHWPATNPSDTGAYAIYNDGDITDEDGKNTIYLAALPPAVAPGDTVRVWAYCLTHGEYVDFLTLQDRDSAS